MGRKTITVPAAGVSKAVPMTGKSIMILSGPSHFLLSDFAEVSFNDPGARLPAVPRSTFQFEGEDCFERLVVTGTEESAGDELEVLFINGCLGSRINTNILETHKTEAGTTGTKQASDAVQQFTELELVDADGNLPKRLYIFVTGGATRGINYAFDADPTQGDGATDASYWNNDAEFNAANTAYEKPKELERLEIEGIDRILKFRFIATVNLETPTLIWDADY